MIFHILIAFIFTSCSIGNFHLKGDRPQPQKTDDSAQEKNEEVFADNKFKRMFVMTSEKLYAGTFLLSDFVDGRRTRLSYIQNGTPVKVLIEDIHSNISELLSGARESKFIKVITYTNQIGYLERENLLEFNQIKNKSTVFLIKSPYSAIQGYYGNQLTRTQNSLILGQRYGDLVYAEVWNNLREKPSWVRTKFDFDSFMIDALPLNQSPLVKFEYINQLEKSCLEDQKFDQKMKLEINKRIFLLIKSFNCIDSSWDLFSLSLTEDSIDKTDESVTWIKIDRSENYFSQSMKSSKLYIYKAAPSVDYFSLDKQIKDILYLDLKKSKLKLSDLELYIIVDYIKTHFFDYASTKIK